MSNLTYKVVVSNSIGHLENEVSFELLKGWKCQGGVMKGTGNSWYQAITKI